MPAEHGDDRVAIRAHYQGDCALPPGGLLAPEISHHRDPCSGKDALRAALHRNVYRGAEIGHPKLDALATYVRAASEALKAADDTDIVAGTFAWPAP